MPSPRRFALISLSVLTATAMVRAQGPLLVPADLAALGYFQYWESSLDLDRARGLTGAHLLDDTLYFTTDSGEAHAMQAGAGLPRWSQNVAESVYEIFPPTHFRGPAGRPMVVFTTSARTLVIDRLMGDVIADMPIDRAVAGAGVITGSRLYFGSADGHLYCMNWTDPRTNSAVLIWRVMAGGPVTGRPLLVNNDDDLIFASQGGSVFCCTAAQKVLNWRARTGGPIIGEIALDGPGVFVAGTDRSLYRFNALSGTREWRLRFPEPLNQGPVVNGGIVFQFCEGEGITAVDAENGEVLWQVADAQRFLCRGVDDALLVSRGGEIIQVAVATGKTLHRVKLPGNVMAVRNTTDDTLYLASNQGQVLCAKRIGTPHLTPQQLADARRTLHKPVDAPQTAAEIEPPPRRAVESGILDPDDPLRSPSDAPAGR
jgi:outer membrane protein assembly factor BamB